MGNDLVKGAGAEMAAKRLRAYQHGARDREDHAARGGYHRRGQPVALEHRRQKSRPGVTRIGFAPQSIEDPRDVHLEWVRRRVLAMVKTGSAAVAEVRKVAQIFSGEGEAHLHRREDRAVAFAVAAGVAD